MHQLLNLFEELKVTLTINKDDKNWCERAIEASSKLINVHQFRLAKNLLLVSELKGINALKLPKSKMTIFLHIIIIVITLINTKICRSNVYLELSFALKTVLLFQAI